MSAQTTQSTETTETLLRDALRHQSEGRDAQAAKLIRNLPALTTLTDRAAYLRLKRALGAPLDKDEAALDRDLAAEIDGNEGHYDKARALYLLGRASEALVSAEQAQAAARDDRGPALLLLKIHLGENRPEQAVDAILQTCEALKSPGGLLLAAAKVVGQTGHKPQAERLLEAAEPHQGEDRAEFDYVAAGIRGTAPAKADQGKMAASIFDKFANDYDEVLASIGNNGPELIGKMLDALPIARKRKLDVLDAGCGTGLCAKILKPYAKQLHGADISVPMLEKAKTRNQYQFLTRTDLNLPATIPAGPFDLVVLADVLLYFGDLTPVLPPLVQRLKPGGWLLLTVEDGGEMGAPGYVLGASGRHKHALAHVAHAMSAAGLGKTKFEMRETLRHEFGAPVPGLALAAQKPMLAF